MGLGDDLMATAIARSIFRKDPTRKVAIGDGERFQPSEVFWFNPIVATPQDIRGRKPVQWLRHTSGCRPYIDYDRMQKPIKSAPRFYWIDIGPLEPGEIHFSRAEREPLARGDYVVIEPHIKDWAISQNKDWGFERHKALVASLPGVRFVQPDYGKEILPGVEPVKTRTFRDACRLLRDAKAYVGPEGGLHHASAAVGIPAVVIYGGFNAPSQTGYPGHINLFTGGDACGMRIPCPHCAAAMRAITPAMVADALVSLL